MAYDGDYIQYKRWDQFHFFNTSVALNSTIGLSDTLNFSVPWKLAELRLHFSTALVSDLTFRARLSSVKDSSLNVNLISYACVGSQDIFWHFSDPLLFFSDDHLVMTTSTISVTNLVGGEIVGWAVRG